MSEPALRQAQAAEANVVRVPAGTDQIEWYFEQGWTDGLPVVPPTRERVDAVVEALGGDAGFIECRVPPRYGSLSREVLAINMVMAGCKPEYAPVVRAALLALTAEAFNLNGVRMNGGANAFGSGNRANATHRTCFAPRPAQCRRRAAGRTGQEHSRQPGQV